MKRVLFLCAILMFFQLSCDAKDYAKIHMKQMKKNQEFRIDNTYFAEYTPSVKNVSLEIKDPKLIKLGGYEDISSEKLKTKLAKDKAEYANVSKYLASKKLNEYYMQAYDKDFYRVYRVAEKIIRANGLDFINWRLTISSENVFNAYNSQTNNVAVLAGALDTLSDNDDALALLLGHEFAHGILGHQKRMGKYIAKINRARRMLSYTAYHIALKKYNKASRDMEYEADIVGAQLAAKAGYNLDDAKETLAYMNTLQGGDELNATHPESAKRIENFEQNRKYFMESEWAKQGVYNIYVSEVLRCEKSSNRSSIVLNKGKRQKQETFYNSESPLDLYLRYGYNSYLAGDFKEAIKYFKDYLKLDKSNYAVYLYISYAYEYLYQQNGGAKNLEFAKEFASYAKKLAPENKHVKDQVLAL